MADTTFAAELAAAAAANAVVDQTARAAAADAKVNPTLTSAAIVAVGGDTTARAAAAAAATTATTAAVDPVARGAQRTTVPKGAFLCDSRGLLGAWRLSGALYPNTYTQNIGMQYHLTAMTGGRVVFPERLNFSVASADTTQLVSQTFATLAQDPILTTPPLAVASFPNLTPLEACAQSDADFAIVLASTNDRPKQFSAATSKSNIQTAITRLRAAGKQVILLAEYPRGDTAFPSLRLAQPYLSDHMEVAKWVRDRRISGVAVIDPWPALALASSTTGDAIVGKTRDGIHASFTGQFDVSTILAATINNMFPPYNWLRSSNTDIWSANLPSGALTNNPMMVGSGSTQPTGWSHAVPAGCTLSYSYDATSGLLAPFALTGTPTAATPKYVLFQSISPAKVAVGDVLQSASDIRVGAGASGYTELSLQQILYKPDNSAYLDHRLSGANTPFPSIPTTVVSGASGAYGGLNLTEQSIPIPAGGIGTSSQLRIEAVLTQNVPVNIPLAIGPTDCRKIAA